MMITAIRVFTWLLGGVMAAMWAGSAAADHDNLRGLDTVVPEDVRIIYRDDGIVFADRNGMTLYVYDKDLDTPGVSSCYDERHCERRWPPLPAPDLSVSIGAWSATERRDGSFQWVYKGSPVYTSGEDLSPGVMSGDNAGQVWHAVFQPYTPPETIVPPGLAVKRAGANWTFANSQDRLLYFPAGLGDSGCIEDCLYAWEPLTAPALARPIGDWTIQTRPDGTRQWVYQNKPAYLRRQTAVVRPDLSGWSELTAVDSQDDS